METRSSGIFEHRIFVSPNDIDVLGHVNNIVYLRWVQEIASAHWTMLSNDEINKKYVWVVLRHEIDYLQPALQGDEILLKTWVGKNAGVKSERHTGLFNASNGKQLAKAITTWCLLDAATMRPKRIEEDILALFRNGA